MTKKIISLVLIAAMMLTMIPASVFATDTVDSYLEFSGFPTTWVNEHADFTITAKDGVTAMSVNGNAVESVGGTVGGGVVTTGGKPYVKYKVLNYDEGILDIGVFLGNINAGSGFFTFKYDTENWSPYDIKHNRALTALNTTHRFGSCLISAFTRDDYYIDEEYPEDNKNTYGLTEDQAAAIPEAFEEVTLETSERAAAIDFTNGVVHITWYTSEALDGTNYEMPVFRFALLNKGNGTINASTITEPAFSELINDPSVSSKDASTQMDIGGVVYASAFNNLDYVVETLDGTMYGCTPSVPGTFKYEGNTATAESFKVDITANGTPYSKTYEVLVDTVKPTLTVEPEEITEPVKKVTFTIDASDNESRIEKVTVSVNGGTERIIGSEYEATVDGSYVFTAYDKAGNKTEVTRIIGEGIIDNAQPVVTVSGAPEGWVNTDVTLTVTTNETATVVAYKDGEESGTVNGTSYVATETGTYKFVATDVAGNVGESEEYEIKIDKVDPTLVRVSDEPIGWNSPYYITFSISDEGGSGMELFTVNGEELNDSSYEVTENGIYTFVLTDKAGNSTVLEIPVTNIDEFYPTISDISELPNTWVKDYNLTFTVSDNETGISTVTVNGETARVVNGVVTYTVTENGDVEIIVTDRANNSITNTISIVDVIDEEAPIVEEPEVPSEPCQEFTLKITATDSQSGIDKVTVDGNDATFNETEGVWEFLIDANGTYVIKAYDRVGRASEEVEVVVDKIDRIEPGITFPGFEDVWTNEDVEITIVVDKAYETLTVSKDGGNAEVVDGTIYIVTENGTYTFTATDAAGNEGTKDITVSKIDRVDPEIFVTGKPEGFVKSFNAEIAASDDMTDVTVTVSVDGGDATAVSGTYPITANGEYVFTATDLAGNTKDYTLNVDNIDNVKPEVTVNYNDEFAKEVTVNVTVSDNKSSVITVTLDGEPFTADSFVVTENGDYVLVAVDEAGNEAKLTISITNIDNAGPTVALNEAPTEWTNSFILSITANDTQSGVAQIKVNGEEIDGTTYEVPANGTYTVVAVDNLGNESEPAEITVDKLDKDAPSLEVTEAPTEWTKEHTFTITASDALSEVKEVTVNGVKLEGATYTVTANGDYKFVVTDNAGNVAEKTVTVDKIDVSAPVFSGNIEETEISADTITVSLPTATDDSGMAVTYELFLNGEKVDAYANESSYTFTGLTVATLYTVKLVATDIVDRTAEVVLETATAGLGKIEVLVDLSDLDVSAETLHMNVYIGDKSVPVDKDGKAVFKNLSAGTYTITFKAAGFFDVAKAEIVVSDGDTATVTFSKQEIIAGDTTGDGVIDIYDLNAVACAFAESYDGETGLIYDFNRDGKVNAEDIEILVANYNKAMAE